jgi:hypothetical protein
MIVVNSALPRPFMPCAIPTTAVSLRGRPYLPAPEPRSATPTFRRALPAALSGQARHRLFQELRTSRRQRLPVHPQRPNPSAAKLPKRTLTNLSNEKPTWLKNAHRKLDEAVFAAYGWPADLSDDEILARLLELNLARTASSVITT